MRHSRKEARRRYQAFVAFLENNPPRMPESFTNKDYRRVEGYAFVAFCCGWNTGKNDTLKKKDVDDDKP